MKNLFIVKNVEFEKVDQWSSNYDLDSAEVEKELAKLPPVDAEACKKKLEHLNTPAFKNFHWSYQYCVFTKRDCGHVEILQTHFIDDENYIKNIHEGRCTSCVCNWNNN